jgi:hypothetical protein
MYHSEATVSHSLASERHDERIMRHSKASMRHNEASMNRVTIKFPRFNVSHHEFVKPNSQSNTTQLAASKLHCFFHDHFSIFISHQLRSTFPLYLHHGIHKADFHSEQNFHSLQTEEASQKCLTKRMRGRQVSSINYNQPSDAKRNAKNFLLLFGFPIHHSMPLIMYHYLCFVASLARFLFFKGKFFLLCLKRK